MVVKKFNKKFHQKIHQRDSSEKFGKKFAKKSRQKFRQKNRKGLLIHDFRRSCTTIGPTLHLLHCIQKTRPGSPEPNTTTELLVSIFTIMYSELYHRVA